MSGDLDKLYPNSIRLSRSVIPDNEIHTDMARDMITLGTNYTIENSSCECVNGLDKCHHKASILLYGYKNVSKTDVRQSWIKHPKSARPRQTQTMENLFPAPDRFINYR